MVEPGVERRVVVGVDDLRANQASGTPIAEELEVGAHERRDVLRVDVTLNEVGEQRLDLVARRRRDVVNQHEPTLTQVLAGELRVLRIPREVGEAGPLELDRRTTTHHRGEHPSCLGDSFVYAVGSSPLPALEERLVEPQVVALVVAQQHRRVVEVALDDIGPHVAQRLRLAEHDVVVERTDRHQVGEEQRLARLLRVVEIDRLASVVVEPLLGNASLAVLAGNGSLGIGLHRLRLSVERRLLLLRLLLDGSRRENGKADGVEEVAHVDVELLDIGVGSALDDALRQVDVLDVEPGRDLDRLDVAVGEVRRHDLRDHVAVHVHVEFLHERDLRGLERLLKLAGAVVASRSALGLERLLGDHARAQDHRLELSEALLEDVEVSAALEELDRPLERVLRHPLIVDHDIGRHRDRRVRASLVADQQRHRSGVALRAVLVGQRAAGRVAHDRRRVGVLLEVAIGEPPIEPEAPPEAVGVADAGVAPQAAVGGLALVREPQRVKHVVVDRVALRRRATGRLHEARVVLDPVEVAVVVPVGLGAFRRQRHEWLPGDGLDRAVVPDRRLGRVRVVRVDVRPVRIRQREPLDRRLPPEGELVHVVHDQRRPDLTKSVVDEGCDLSVRALDRPARSKELRLDEEEGEGDHRVATHETQTRDRDALNVELREELVQRGERNRLRLSLRTRGAVRLGRLLDVCAELRLVDGLVLRGELERLLCEGVLSKVYGIRLNHWVPHHILSMLSGPCRCSGMPNGCSSSL